MLACGLVDVSDCHGLIGARALLVHTECRRSSRPGTGGGLEEEIKENAAAGYGSVGARVLEGQQEKENAQHSEMLSGAQVVEGCQIKENQLVYIGTATEQESEDVKGGSSGEQGGSSGVKGGSSDVKGGSRAYGAEKVRQEKAQRDVTLSGAQGAECQTKGDAAAGYGLKGGIRDECTADEVSAADGVSAVVSLEGSGAVKWQWQFGGDGCRIAFEAADGVGDFGGGGASVVDICRSWTVGDNGWQFKDGGGRILCARRVVVAAEQRG